jgi:uncharacterized RDD family membrane protein YckC
MDETNIEYVGFWARVGAAIIDSILVLAIIIPALTVIYGRNYWSSDVLIAGFWDFMLNFILPAIAIIVFWIYRRATPGKMVFKAVIVDEKTGNKPDLRQWIVRYLGYYVSIIGLGLGILWVAWDQKKQGWHDKMAGTVVIRRIK